MSSAKGVTCGYVPLGGVAVSKPIAEYFDDHLLSCGLTYSGHPLACVAGIACVNYYREQNILDNVNARLVPPPADHHRRSVERGVGKP